MTRLQRDYLQRGAEICRDMLHACRVVSRSPVVSVTTVLMLAVALGINGVVVAFVQQVLFSAPAAVADAARLVRVQNSWLLEYEQYESLVDGMRSMTLAAQTSPTTMSIDAGADAEPIQVRFVTPNYFSTLGVRPTIGRLFDARLDGSSEYLAVLGHGFWRRRYGGDPSVVDASANIGNTPYTVIGVTPERFTGVDTDRIDVWLLAGTTPVQAGLWLVGRLADDVMLAQAQAELRARYPAVVPILETGASGDRRVLLGAVHESAIGAVLQLNPILVTLLGAGAALLLIACTNASGLLLSRVFTRRHEFAVRVQLGATRGQLVREIVMGVLVLSMLASVLAIAVAYYGLPVFERALQSPIVGRGLITPFHVAFFNLQMQEHEQVFTTLPLFGAMALYTCGSIAVCSAAPAWYVCRGDFGRSLNVSGSSGLRHSNLRQGLLAIQVAMSVALLIVAGLFVRSFQRALDVDFGIDADNVLVVSPNLRRAGYEASERQRVFDEMANAVSRHPEVLQVSLSIAPPIGLAEKYHVAVDFRGYPWPWGIDRLAGRARPPFVESVSPAYFSMLGIRLLEGRAFTDRDQANTPPVVIVNERLARDVYGSDSPLNQCIEFATEDECRWVVGVVTSVRNELVRTAGVDDGDYDAAFYFPATQLGAAVRYLLVRTQGDPGRVVTTLRSALQDAAPSLPFITIERLSRYRDHQLHGWRVSSVLLGAFGVVATILAAIGVYALLAFTTRQRAHEFGVRLAVGATRWDIVAMSVRGGLWPVVLGVGAGAGCAVLSMDVLDSLLFGVAPLDPLALAIAALLMGGAGLVACVAPAIRASRVDAAMLLRSE